MPTHPGLLDGFVCVRAPCRYKVLRLPANPVLSTKKGVVQLTNPSMGVVAPRAGLPATRRIRLGLMPVVEG